jgi:hypothetical protein
MKILCVLYPDPVTGYEWAINGGWNIADCVARSYDVQGMRAGTVAAGHEYLVTKAGKLAGVDAHSYSVKTP